MQLVLITPPKTSAAEPKLCNSLFKAGLPLLHVRKPAAGVQEIRQYLQQLDPSYLNRVVLHQYHDLVYEFPIKGIHFKERDRPAPPLERIKPGISQSTSFHSMQDIVQDWQNLDYAFLSPIFDSISKEGYSAAAFDHDELSLALKKAAMPVYALGGITPDRLADVKKMGFAGVGVLGAVWDSSDPVLSFQEFQQRL